MRRRRRLNSRNEGAFALRTMITRKGKTTRCLLARETKLTFELVEPLEVELYVFHFDRIQISFGIVSLAYESSISSFAPDAHVLEIT